MQQLETELGAAASALASVRELVALGVFVPEAADTYVLEYMEAYASYVQAHRHLETCAVCGRAGLPMELLVGVTVCADEADCVAHMEEL
jgi:hypothetical protein